jgi:hypothetical protein
MTHSSNNLFDKIFRDRKGKIAIWQFPNPPLFGWLVFTIVDKIFKDGKPHTGFHLLAQASLLTWAYLELRSGDSVFRRALGAVVFILITISFFTQK